MRCLTSTGPIAFDAEGKQEPRVFRFEWTAVAGLRGLGQDKAGHLFQTEDLGRTWLEVQAPPVHAERTSLANRCSDAGCLVNGWLRTGWEPTPSKPVDPPELVELAGLGMTRLPTLSCVAERAAQPVLWRPTPARASAGEQEEDDPSKRWLAGFGVESLREDYFQSPLETPFRAGVDGNALRGILSTFAKELHDPRNPDETLVEIAPLRFRYVDSFDPSAHINVATVAFAELTRAALRSGAPPPSTDFESLGSLSATPVLAREPGRTAGFVTTLDRARVWVNGGRVTVLTPWDDTWSMSSAVLDRDGSLLVLMTADGEAPRIWRFRQGGGVELFGAPATPLRSWHATSDALGISEQGQSVVLRFPSGNQAPSKVDPVLAYAPGKPLEQLAPWSSVRLASDPACADKSGYRAVVLPAESWFTLRQGATEVSGSWGMLVAVRWSKERVCLEALEVAADTFWRDDSEEAARLVLASAQKMAAARVSIGAGFELRQPLSCKLENSL